MGGLGHIFLSYARTDGSEFVHKLDKALPKEGFKTWLDERGIDPSQDFTAELEQAIEAASYVVTCVTPDIKRPDSFVRREIAYASLSRKPIIVARFHDTIPPINVVTHTWVDFFKEWDISFSRLCEILSKPPSSFAPPTPAQKLDDPFKAYLEDLYQHIVDLLGKTVISMIDLGSESTPDAVLRPKRTMMEQLFHSHGISQNETFRTFAEAFQKYKGRVLLLGEPGSGKTITLLAHARDAIALRLSDPNAPLPLFGLIPSWGVEKQLSIPDWLIENGEYLDIVHLKNAIQNKNTLLLLDGLDELAATQTTITGSINEVHSMINQKPCYV